LAISWSKLGVSIGIGVLVGATYWTIEPEIRERFEDRASGTESSPIPVASASPTDPILVGAGDIASCAQDNDEKTAQLLDATASEAVGEVVVFTAGDNAYETGTPEEFQQCYEPTWGRHKDRTRPAPGNHEYETPSGAGYFRYFGPSAGDPTLGYYSFDLGVWHIIVLNTSDHCFSLSCDAGSPKEKWLRSDLAAHPALCTLAIWHDPLNSSSARKGGERSVRAFWDVLYEWGADVVINGHSHNYERFARQRPSGIPDTEHGIRQFVVGTGGNGHDHFAGDPIANSEAANDTTYGVLKLTLHPGSYDWEFVPEQGGTFTDAGSDNCHSSR
jgi:acid phosphatase type 7